MREVIIEKSKTIQIPVIIGTPEDLKKKGLSPEEVYAPILIKDMVSGIGQFMENYPKAIFINSEVLFDLQNAEFFSLIVYSMRFALENSTNLYGYIINHLYELCDLEHETLEELFEEIYKVQRRILVNKTKAERSKISLLEAIGDYYVSIDSFPESDAVAYGCITGSYYSFRKGLLSTEDYYEIRDMFVPFGISITQTKIAKDKLFDDFCKFFSKYEKNSDVLYLKKIGKLQDEFTADEDDSFNADLFDAICFDENDNE